MRAQETPRCNFEGMISALKDVMLNWGYTTNRYDTIREKFMKPGRESYLHQSFNSEGWGSGEQLPGVHEWVP